MYDKINFVLRFQRIKIIFHDLNERRRHRAAFDRLVIHLLILRKNFVIRNRACAGLARRRRSLSDHIAAVRIRRRQIHLLAAFAALQMRRVNLFVG